MSLVNSAKRGWFKTYKHSYVAGVLTATLYDAPVTKLSLRNRTTGTEEVLTYGGTDTFDSQLTRVAVGSFEWWFVPLTVGRWEANEEWTETIGGQTVPVKGNAITFIVTTDLATWSDIPPSTP